MGNHPQVGALIAAGVLPAAAPPAHGSRPGRRPGDRRGHRCPAYRELEGSGLVVSRRRTGTVVADGGRLGTLPVHQAVSALVGAGRQAGPPDDDVLALGPGRPDGRAPLNGDRCSRVQRLEPVGSISGV